MSMLERATRRLLTGLLMLWSGVVSAQPPMLGEPIDAKTVESLIIWPDGRGLPAGSGTIAAGQRVYERHCLACHGVEGRGGLNDQLVGGQVALNAQPPKRTVGSYWPYATTLFDYIRRSMPYNTPGTLNTTEVYSVTAYLLFLNQIIASDTILDAEQLKSIELPNRARFYSAYPLPQ